MQLLFLRCLAVFFPFTCIDILEIPGQYAEVVLTLAAAWRSVPWRRHSRFHQSPLVGHVFSVCCHPAVLGFSLRGVICGIDSGSRVSGSRVNALSADFPFPRAMTFDTPIRND